MRRWLLGAVVALSINSSVEPALAQDARSQDIIASYRASFGREPNGGEVNYWKGRQDWRSREDLIRFHLQGLQSNPGLQQEAVVNAFARAGLNPGQAVIDHWKRQLGQQPRRFDVLISEVQSWVQQRSAAINASYQEALGRAPAPAEITYWQTRVDYAQKADLIQLHRQGIKSNAGLGDEVVTNSYLRAFGRRPAQGELQHWRQHARLGWTCAEMIAEHEAWKRKVPPTIKQTPKLTAAMKRQNVFLDTSNNLVKLDAASAARLTGGSIVAAGAGNLVAQAGGYLIGMDGASIVAAGGGNIVAAGGGN